jgi:Phospholipase_D-nuclease N-terminal
VILGDGVFALLEIGLLIFCVIDIIQSRADEIRGLSKGFWLILVIILPIVGGIAWLVAGRPTQVAAGSGWRPGAGFPESQRPQRARPPMGPDDDADFLREMRSVNTEQEETLKRWEEDLRRREAEQRRREGEE